ncbi:hypothetical protein BDF20DRAFT_868737 [Mycotypha africana]|uniref:uncharacterized protein n=1 Tax=Mycotypha africana TaxID=64632 RepID=UPI0022FFC841|nr:uncharacterized protein BDF20DRAFT_868737 [Mycotypha africana]KAI8979299.1 hypothetical protein BDF20DRAFT_868737 [Mycotypha africana]
MLGLAVVLMLSSLQTVALIGGGKSLLMALPTVTILKQMKEMTSLAAVIDGLLSTNVTEHYLSNCWKSSNNGEMTAKKY